MHNTLLSGIATFLAQHGGAPGAYIDVAEAALVTAENLTARGDTLFITRLPAPYNACGRLIAEAVAHNTWTALGVIAHPQPPPHRPGTASTASEGEGTLSGTPSRAVVLHASAQDQRRQQRLAREIQASQRTWQTTARVAEQQTYCARGCRGAAARGAHRVSSAGGHR